MGTTLFVAGFGSRTRARDLAYEFERYGRLVRCDIPAPKSFSSKPYAFVEFEDPRDAEDSFNEMHGRRIDGYTISVQWARNAPSSSWRFDRSSTRRRRSPSPPPPPPQYGRSPSRSPYGRSPPIHGGYHHHPPPPPHQYPGRPLSPHRGRSPPLMRDRYDRSPPPGRPLTNDYPSTTRRPSFERRPSQSPSPMHHHYRGGPSSRSPSPPPRRSVSPRRSRSPP
ncbi:hypothetical protein BC941DRAFT_445990 [Chlamydoabsidia padenii]|nr:hypothetical protein BC941DRAFT_445990 [Chlamydoabsidia padenii]